MCSSDLELSYFHLEEEGVNLKLKKGADIVQVAQAAMPAAAAPARSEERRVGKECRSRWEPNN